MTGWPPIAAPHLDESADRAERVTTGPEPGSRRRRLRLVVPLLGYIVAAALLLSGTWSHPGSRLPGVRGDSRLFAWFLGWLPHAVTHGQNPLLTNALHAPTGVNLMSNTSMPLAGLLLWPVTATAGPVVAYTVLLTLAFALSGWAAFLAFTRLVPSTFGCFLGGLVFGFSPYQLTHGLSQPNLMVCAFPPLLLALVVDLFGGRRSPRRTGVLLGLLVAAQLLVGEEILLTSVLMAMLGLIIAALLDRQRVGAGLRHLGRSLPVATLVALPIVAFPLWVQFAGPDRVTTQVHGPASAIRGANLVLTALPSPVLAMSPGSSSHLQAAYEPLALEASSYALPALVVSLVAVALVRRERRLAAGALLFALLAVLLSLGYEVKAGKFDLGPGPWRPLSALPLLREALPARFTMYAYLVAGLAVALLVRAVLDVTASTGARVLAGGTVAAALAAGFPALPYPHLSAPTPQFFATRAVADRIPDGCMALVAPISRDALHDEAAVWQAQAGYRYRDPNGYAILPPGPGTLGPFFAVPSRSTTAFLQAETRPVHSSPADLTAMRDELRRWQACAIIVGPMPNQQNAVDAATRITGRPPEWVGGVAYWPVPR